ncbi:unnamed protein product [marine sediment metagenome]|uniref:Uncharacterized protein n=1 Tax=marine sediment metagenome TaxID=412755 RepID=X0XRN6_9ZZZZ
MLYRDDIMYPVVLTVQLNFVGFMANFSPEKRMFEVANPVIIS